MNKYTQTIGISRFQLDEKLAYSRHADDPIANQIATLSFTKEGLSLKASSIGYRY